MEFTTYMVETVYATYQLIPKVIAACEQAHVYLDSHMRYGFFVPFNLFALSSVSRLWAMFKAIGECTRSIFQSFKNITSIYSSPFSCPLDTHRILELGLDMVEDSAKPSDGDEDKSVKEDAPLEDETFMRST